MTLLEIGFNSNYYTNWLASYPIRNLEHRLVMNSMTCNKIN